MIREALRRLKSVVENDISGRLNRRVHYIADTSNWSFKWDAHYISQGLAARLGNPVLVNTTPWQMRHQVFIFGNRYAWLNGPHQQLHRSNKVIVTWFHGDPTDPDPAMQNMFKQLPAIFDRVDRVVVTCDYSAQVLIDHGVATEKLVKICLGVDLAKFVPPDVVKRQQIRDSLDIAPEMFCIGSFQKDGKGWEEGMEPKPIKGPDVFLDTMALLKKDHTNLMVLLTGPARGYIKNGLDRLEIPYRHTFFDDYLDIVPYYQALDLYLITSRGEGGPKALLEGGACGVPLVSTRVGMPNDLIQPGENGFLADIEDSRRLASHISTLISDPILREKCREGGLQTVQKYDWQQIADSYHTLVRGL